MIDKKDFLKLNKIIFDMIYKLSDDEIINILNGNVKISLKDKKKKKIEQETESAEEMTEIYNKIIKFETRKEAEEYLNKKKFTVKFLKKLAQCNNIYINSRCRKSEIIDGIIEGTIGVRLKFNALSD